MTPKPRRPRFVVVGSGLTGATIARVLTDAGHSTLVVERRGRVGGNIADDVHESGIRFHSHGPHYFRTSSDRIWTFVNRFASFRRYEARVLSCVDGRLEQWPVSGEYIRRLGYPVPERRVDTQPQSFEEAMLSIMPGAVYERFIKEYTEKQWGISPRLLSARLAKRVKIHWDGDPRLTPHARYQGLPTEGYSTMVERMLEGIPQLLGVDYLANREIFRPGVATVFTGPIDAYFGYSHGRLVYRGQKRKQTFLVGGPVLPVAQVNEPQHVAGRHIRVIDWSRMMPKQAQGASGGTLITQETPFTATDPDDCEYPFPDARNSTLYRRYREMADELGNVLICGRLGEYRYYDMDQAIGRAQMLAERLLTDSTGAAFRIPLGASR